jgi:hypothetical protein
MWALLYCYGKSARLEKCDHLICNHERLQAATMETRVRLTQQAAREPAKTADLIETLQTSIAAVHERYVNQQKTLHGIIDLQNTIMTEVEAQSIQGSIAALENLAESRKAAVERVANGFETVLNALRRAFAQEALSREESLALWQSSRRALLVREKVALMAHAPCTATPNGIVGQVIQHPFTLQAASHGDFVEVMILWPTHCALC